MNKGILDTLWYSDENDSKIWVDIDRLTTSRPVGAKYQHSRFPKQLTEVVLKLNDDGTSTHLATGTSTYPIDLVLAIYNDGGYKWDEAVILVAASCERCMNALAYEYGLKWGYPVGSEEWKRCGTTCSQCR